MANDTQEKRNPGVYLHKFNQPVTVNGKPAEELTFKFEDLRGLDAIAIEAELMAEGRTYNQAAFSDTYLAKFAARAAGIGSDVIELLPLREFNRITRSAQSFLLFGDWAGTDRLIGS